MKRAYIFTLDVIIAATVLTAMMTSIYFMLGNMNPNQPDYRYLTAKDSLGTLDLSGDLQKSIKNSDGSKISEYLDNAMQPQFCGTIKVKDQTDSTIINTTKSNCNPPTGDITVERRMIMVKGDPYRVKMEVWAS